MEDQLIIKFPDREAEIISKKIENGYGEIEGLGIEFIDEKRFNFRIDDEIHPGMSFELPNYTETQILWEDGHLFKSGDIGEILVVEPKIKDLLFKRFNADKNSCFPKEFQNNLINENLYHSGISEQTKNIVTKRIKKLNSHMANVRCYSEPSIRVGDFFAYKNKNKHQKSEDFIEYEFLEEVVDTKKDAKNDQKEIARKSKLQMLSLKSDLNIRLKEVKRNEIKDKLISLNAELNKTLINRDELANKKASIELEITKLSSKILVKKKVVESEKINEDLKIIEEKLQVLKDEIKNLEAEQ